jgi:predicted acetyltransferase
MIQGPQRASLDDFDSIIELVDECFSRERDSGGMLARWPHCYIRQPEIFRNCLIMKDGSKAVSLVEYVDQTLLVEGGEIKVAGITAVATWPSYRGRGFMTQLLKRCISLMSEDGYAFSDLGGDTLRYGRFGWENAGHEWTFRITQRSFNAADAPVGLEVTQYQARPEEIDGIVTIHEQEPLRMKRTRQLYEMLLGRLGKQVWLTRGSKGITAYVVTHPGEKYQRIVEFGGSAEGVHAIFTHLIGILGSESLGLHSPYYHPLNATFFSISSGWNLGPRRMTKIIDLEATLRGFAHQLGARYAELGIKGRHTVALEIAGTGRQVEIEFNPDEVTVRKVSRSSEALKLSERQMARFIFGPGSPSITLDLPQNLRFLDAAPKSALS